MKKKHYQPSALETSLSGHPGLRPDPKRLSLSAFLIKAISVPPGLDGTARLESMYRSSLHLTKLWLRQHPRVEARIRHAFESVTEVPYDENRDRVAFAYAGHYAEKAFLARTSGESARSFLKGRLSRDLVTELRSALGGGSVVLFSAHFGAVDFLPGMLATEGLPVSVILRFKSEMAKLETRRLARELGVELIDANEGIPVSVRRARREPRIIFTACDAFRHWRRSESERIWLNKPFHLDRTPRDLIRLFSATPFFAALERERGPQGFTLRTQHQALSNSSEMAGELFEAWRVLIARCPFQPYNWEEFHEIWSMDPLSIPCLT